MDFNESYDKIEMLYHKYFGGNSDCTIYHYTKKKVYKKIIKTKKLRITNVCYFGDRLEYDYGKRFAIKVLKEQCKQENYDNKFYMFLERQILRLYKTKHEYFVFSSCLDRNNEYLQGKYGKYTIEINAVNFHMLNNAIFEDNHEEGYQVYHGEVIYDENKQKEILLEIFSLLNQQWEIDKPKMCNEINVGFLNTLLWKFLLMFKIEKYYMEREYRIMLETFPPDDIFVNDDSRQYLFLKEVIY